jgi:D-2-hydroxyacid dehydrogenase (NADP+)
MDAINVLVVSAMPESCLSKIAAVNPKIKVYDASHINISSNESTAEHKVTISDKKFDELLAQAEIIYGIMPPRNVVIRAPNLKWIQTTLAGVDHFINTDIIQSHVIVTNTSGIQASAVSETGIELMLMCAKQAQRCFQMKVKKEWQNFIPALLRYQTVGIVGFGNIGKEVARLAKSFGMRVVGMDMKTRRSRYADIILPSEKLTRLLAESDFVVLTLPLTKETEGLIGSKEFKAMKPNAYLINIARGKIVDEQAMVKALKGHLISGVALDTFTIEPLPLESQLWELPNVIMSPHVGGRMASYDSVATEFFCKNLKRYIDGKRLLNVVNKKLGF